MMIQGPLSQYHASKAPFRSITVLCFSFGFFCLHSQVVAVQVPTLVSINSSTSLSMIAYLFPVFHPQSNRVSLYGQLQVPLLLTQVLRAVRPSVRLIVSNHRQYFSRVLQAVSYIYILSYRPPLFPFFFSFRNPMLAYRPNICKYVTSNVN